MRVNPGDKVCMASVSIIPSVVKCCPVRSRRPYWQCLVNSDLGDQACKQKRQTKFTSVLSPVHYLPPWKSRESIMEVKGNDSESIPIFAPT
jgi:hypothetical protein